MTILYLVRHAKPAATWGEAIDPGLDPIGFSQAEKAASELATLSTPLPVFSSPLRRCRETAQPLATQWQTSVNILPAVAEIPSPPISAAGKKQWLAEGMSGDWSQLQASALTLAPAAPDYLAWRQALISALRALPGDAVIFSHYIAINVVVGAAQKSERVLNFRPGHASITTIEITKDTLRVLKLGVEAEAGGSVLTAR